METETGTSHRTPDKDSKYLSREEYLLTLLQQNNRYIRTLNLMKKDEQKDGELSNGRRKWFNQEKDRVKSEIREIKEELENERGGM